MPLLGHQIYFRPRVSVTLTFDLLTPKVVNYIMPLTRGPLVSTCIKISSQVFKNITFSTLVTNKQTNERTNGKPENITLRLHGQSSLADA